MYINIRNVRGGRRMIRIKFIGLTVQYFKEDKYLRAEINIRTPFWLSVFRKNTIRICDHQFKF